MKERTIRVGALARVEGEGSLYVKVRGGRVEDLKLRLFEPPRFFEAFLRGKGFMEVPDITSRICGICPAAYQMSSVHALESLLGVSPGPRVRELRRLLYCAEWIESHALHVFMLHAPDFLGYPDALAMAQDHRELVETGLKLKKTGNDLMTLLGGREIHPVSVRVGGFHKAPSPERLKSFVPALSWARDAAEKTVLWAAALPAPDFEQDYEFVALRGPGEYPLNEGRLVSSRGLDVPAEDFERHFEEFQVPHSNALHARRKGGGAYLVGPLARFNLNFDNLPERARRLCVEVGLVPPVRNPFKAIVVRAVEILFACEEALRIARGYEEPEPPYAPTPPRAGEGGACTEAPRGILYHRYRAAADGTILEARIVPPTSQNQARIEQDLRAFVERFIALPKAEFTLRCEQAVRNYDPCISCATHFLDVTLERDG